MAAFIGHTFASCETRGAQPSADGDTEQPRPIFSGAHFGTAAFVVGLIQRPWVEHDLRELVDRIVAVVFVEHAEGPVDGESRREASARA